MRYPKINSLYKREGYDFKETGKKPNGKKLIEGDYACPEFEAIDRWTITEKVDGTNCRVIYKKENFNICQGSVGVSGEDPCCTVEFQGRNDYSEIPMPLYKRLEDLFPLSKMKRTFPKAHSVILFGEGFGGKIQDGSYYSEYEDFYLFDAVIDGFWLSRKSIYDIAKELFDPGVNIRMGDKVNTVNKQQIVEFVKEKSLSFIAANLTGSKHVMEGIVARSEPLMYFRDGTPIMFKLKCSDFY